VKIVTIQDGLFIGTGSYHGVSLREGLAPKFWFGGYPGPEKEVIVGILLLLI